MTTQEKRFERFAEVVSLLKDNYKLKQLEIAQRMGLKDSTYLSKILNQTRELTLDFLEDFITAFPEVNLNYIKYNQGPIFISDDSVNNNILNEPNTALYSSQRAGESNVQQQTAPLMVYNLDEQADNQLTKAFGTISFPGSQTCDFAVNVHGEAMRGAVSNGGTVAVREVNKDEFIAFGHIYLIQTNGMDFVRYVRKCDDKSKVILHAHNDALFDDFELPIKSIDKIFIVRKILNNEA